MNSAELTALVERHFKEAHRGTLAWSSAYHVAFGASAILSVLIAALSAKIGPNDVWKFGIQSQALIAVMAATASVLTTVGAFGGFERKWRANRRSRSELEILMIDIGAGLEEREAISHLRDILRDHESGVMAGPADTPRPAAKPNNR